MEHPCHQRVTTPFWKSRSDSRAYQTAYRLLAEKIPPGYSGRILDVACGTGRLLAKIYPRLKGGSLVGIDNSEEMLYEAERYLKSKNLPAKIYTCVDEVDFEKPSYLVTPHSK